MSKFVADVYGTPDPRMSREEVDAIISRAEANGQNVFFGEGWRHPEQESAQIRTLYMTQPPVEMGFWRSLVAGVAGWLA